MVDLTGQMLLDRYHIRDFIGSGGMARVYQAWDAKRATFVAIKLLNEDMAEDAVFLRRFAREAQALEVLEHPHIVRFFGFEETRGLAFLVMEFIDGVTLRRYLHLLRRPLTLPEALYVTNPVCSALHYAHQMGVYHCDVKPANIFIERGGRVVLADFGIAQLSESATVTFSTPGTPAYMSPEQCQGTEDLDARADIYSLGITTYEMLTLDRPFKGDAGGTTGGRGERVRWEQMHLPPPPPRSVNPRISPAAEAATLRSLEKDPGRRQQGALAFHRELSGVGAMEPVGSLPWVEGLQAPPTGVEFPPPPPPPHKKPLPARGIGVVVGGVGIVLLAVLLLALIPRTLPPPEPPTLEPPLTRDTATATTQVTPIPPTDTPLPPVTLTPMSESTQTLSPTPLDTPIRTSIPTPMPTRTSLPAPSSVSRIAFVVGSVGNTDIYVVDIDGRNQTRIVSRSCDEAEPAWSPDSRHVIFHADCDRSYDIWTADASGGTTMQLTDTSNVDEREPDWSPDGAHIVYRASPAGSDRNSDGELWVMSADGSSQQRLGGTTIMGRTPTWSPDGQKVLFMSQRSGRWQIYVYDLRTGSTTRLTDCGTNCRWPCWSPDGQYIAYHSTISTRGVDSANADTMWTMPAGGGTPIALTSGAHAGRPSWSNNGQIVFNSDFGIEVISANGNDRHVLISGNDSWAPECSR